MEENDLVILYNHFHGYWWHNDPRFQQPRYWAVPGIFMMTSSNGNIFRVTDHLCGEFTGPRWIPIQWPVTWSFYVFFGLRLNKRWSKQSWIRSLEKLSRPLWRHRNVLSQQKIDTCCSVNLDQWIVAASGKEEPNTMKGMDTRQKWTTIYSTQPDS